MDYAVELKKFQLCRCFLFLMKFSFLRNAKKKRVTSKSRGVLGAKPLTSRKTDLFFYACRYQDYRFHEKNGRTWEMRFSKPVKRENGPHR